MRAGPMTKWLQGWATLFMKVLLLSVLPPVLFLIFVEVGSRFIASSIGKNPQALYHGAAELHKIGLPFFSYSAYVARGPAVAIPVKERHYDEQGGSFRDRYFTFQKPDGKYRIVVLGGSTVYSVYTTEENSFPALLENALNSRTGQDRFQVIAAGVAGCNSTQMRDVVQPEIFRFDHDMQIIYELYNDIFRPELLVTRTDRFLIRAHDQLSRFSFAYYFLNGMASRLRVAKFPAEAERILQRYVENIEHMVRECQARGISVVIVKEVLDPGRYSANDGTFPFFFNFYQRSLAELDGIGEKYGVRVIDAASLFGRDASPVKRGLLFYDVAHLTEEGNAHLADIIARDLIRRPIQAAPLSFSLGRDNDLLRGMPANRRWRK